MANSIASLITELAELENWPCVNLDGVLLLYDVCRCLKLSQETTFSLLGNAAIHHLAQKGVINRAAVGTFRV